MRTDLPYAVSISEASALCGVSLSTMRKSFMDPAKRPKGVPNPPPHVRPTPRRVLVLVDGLPGWVAGLGSIAASPQPARKRGAPTKAERIARRNADKREG